MAGPQGVSGAAQQLQQERQNISQVRNQAAQWISTQLGIPGSALERNKADLAIQDAVRLARLKKGIASGGKGGKGTKGTEGATLGDLKWPTITSIQKQLIDEHLAANPKSVMFKNGKLLPQHRVAFKNSAIAEFLRKSPELLSSALASSKGSNSENIAQNILTRTAGELAQHGVSLEDWQRSDPTSYNWYSTTSKSMEAQRGQAPEGVPGMNLTNTLRTLEGENPRAIRAARNAISAIMKDKRVPEDVAVDMYYADKVSASQTTPEETETPGYTGLPGLVNQFIGTGE